MSKRAMTEIAKKNKSEAILSCAAGMFLAADYESVKMSMIARQMHISNGILFVYFPTKQTLFFSLLMREYNARIEALEKHMQEEHTSTYSALCDLILKDLSVQLDNILYVRLEAIRAAILEKNINIEYALSMKTALHRRMVDLASKLSIPDIILTQEILEIFHVQTAMIAGFQFASDIPTPLREQFMQSGLETFLHDPKQDTLKTMQLYLHALKTSR